MEEVKGENKNTEVVQNSADVAKDKVDKIIKKAKEKGKITYGELALELNDINQEQIEKVFDAMEEIGVDVLKDDLDTEPNLDDLRKKFRI